MPDFSYLDQLQAMRNGTKAPPPKKPPQPQNQVTRLSNNAANLQQATALQKPAAGTSAASKVNAAKTPATMQRDAGVSRTTTPRTPIAPPPPTRAVAPVRAPSGGGGGASSAFNYGAIAPSATGAYGGIPEPVMPPPMTDEEYLPTDSIYVSETAGINADVQQLLDDLKRQRSSYDLDFGRALRNLGWTPGENWQQTPGAGEWRQDDMTGAYGSAYNNMQNDFAGRGMLNSSFYGSALEDLLTGFDQQRNDMFGSRQSQIDQWIAEEKAAEDQRRQGLDRARAAALGRRAAGLQLGF